MSNSYIDKDLQKAKEQHHYFWKVLWPKEAKMVEERMWRTLPARLAAFRNRQAKKP